MKFTHTKIVASLMFFGTMFAFGAFAMVFLWREIFPRQPELQIAGTLGTLALVGLGVALYHDLRARRHP